MSRIFVGALLRVLCLSMTLIAGRLVAAEPSETLLPATTKRFVSVADVDDLKAHWQQTQLGQLMDEPVMEPFRRDLREQFENEWTGIQEKLGLEWEDLEDVAGGEVAVALVELAPEQWANVLLADVTGHLERAQAALDKVSRTQLQRGATRTEQQVAGTTVAVFDLPREERLDRDLRAAYFLKDNLLAAADDLRAIEFILTRAEATRADSLAQFTPFRAVMDRCRLDAGDRMPHLRWFIEPFGYFEAANKLAAERSEAATERMGRSRLDMFRNTGFTAIQGMGGFVEVGLDGYEMLHRTAVYAPPPYQSSMKMMVFPNGSQFSPPPWVPRDVAAYASGYCDVVNAFDNVGPLFDERYGQPGVWADVLDSLRNDLDGPQIDLREDMIVHLTNRVIVLSDYKLPITPSSERVLFAIEAKDPEAVAVAIRKNLENEPDVFERELHGHVVWETVPQKKSAPRAVRLELPALGPGPSADEDLVDEQSDPFFPNASFTVANGALMVASHYDFLDKILAPQPQRDTLEENIDWLIVDDTLERLSQGANFMRSFSRSADTLRATYELIRQGKMPEAETMFGRLLNSILGDPESDPPREQKINGSSLPDYDYVRRHLGPAGTLGVSEDNGWFLKGFLLPNEGL